MKFSLVQILVAGAIIQAETLNTEAEKGSMRTAFGHGSVGPKLQNNFSDSLLL